jgi:glycosyltransferase involved in cell wall biosynthesis
LTPFTFLVPGRIDQLTGGYIYDRRVVEALRQAGREVAVVELAGRYPEPDAAAFAAMGEALAVLPDGAAAAIDGLALLAAAELLPRHATRLRLVGMVHHPLALETGLEPGASRRIARLERELLRALAGVICPSERTADAVAEHGVARDRIAIVRPGTDRPAELPPLLPRRGRVRLLTVGTLTPRKGHVLLVEALARLGTLDWDLVCIGSAERDAATAAAVRRAIAAHRLERRVTLAGERAPHLLAAAYLGADLFVLPSFHEGYGMAFAEAMAHGLPVIGTTAGAIPETVPAAAGLLVPPGDVGALADALARLIGDTALRLRLAAGARAAARRLPDWPAAAASWGAAFDRLAA